MNYVEEILDRKTGELVSVDKGDWITIAELARFLGFGRRRATTVLRHLDFLQIEGVGRDSRHRIADWVVQRGWGKRLHRKTDKFPFDVIGPDAVQWIKERWQGAVTAIERETFSGPVAEAKAALDGFQAAYGRKEMTVQMEVSWLADIFPDLTQEQMSSILDVSQQLVSRFLSVRSEQLQRAKALKASFR
ncbi:hypothetical protein [Rhizobium sp. BG4]|uniref:hypothetical protein n=1 Tax=Rhizobium sp. BG4 TaxID=2613770 RepID=UPI00193C8C71|nr:hypothetical protein [Rhizobium sp. BG4]QRM42813.1 hypothetical protein F2982_04875 [Rhizobium sp. BG4]